MGFLSAVGVGCCKSLTVRKEIIIMKVKRILRALLSDGESVREPFWQATPQAAHAIGLAFVFRVFDRVSYALVLNSTKQVELGDWVRKP